MKAKERKRIQIKGCILLQKRVFVPLTEFVGSLQTPPMAMFAPNLLYISLHTRARQLQPPHPTLLLMAGMVSERLI